MSRRKTYAVSGQHFSTQGALDAAIKAALNSHPRDVEFTDEFLAAVVNELHPDVRAHGQRVVLFQYLTFDEQCRRGMPTAVRYRGGGVVMGFFEPLGRWEDVTVYPHHVTSTDGHLRRALREKVSPYLPRPTTTDRCATGGCPVTGFGLEYEHAEPTFKQIADVCLARMTARERATLFGYSKFDPARRELTDLIPDDHPAIVSLLDAHKANRWMWLCKRHHRNVGVSGGKEARP